MKQQLEDRLRELKEEFERGQSKLDALERESQQVRHTMLRISGAIQVIEELLQAPDAPAADA